MTEQKTRELFPIRFMNFDGRTAEKTYTPDAQETGNSVADFRPNVLPADAADLEPTTFEGPASDPKDSAAPKPASDSNNGSSETETPTGLTPSLSEPSDKSANAEKVSKSQVIPLTPGKI